MPLGERQLRGDRHLDVQRGTHARACPLTIRRLVLLAAAIITLALPACRAEDIGKPQPGTVFVSIGDNYFQPDTVTVPLGHAVRWTNAGAVQHTVVSDSLLWQSSLVAPTRWFEMRFDSSGTFPYHCSQHTGMTGTVIVQ
ncbi:MAG TPA: cupredoxin domain-containing protein [Gemmatimonadales bacterium]|nr:cupredoxin domain-containing protein [Gemmatimonadales bacterium]